MTGVNRIKQQERKTRKERRQELGEYTLAEERRKSFDNDWTLDWFKPKGAQMDCIDCFEDNIFSLINGSSGCGKTSTALWWALNQYKQGNYQKLIFIKNPTEVGDDKIGFLSGDRNDKLQAHFDTTKRIFHDFMSKNKLENDIAKDRIRLEIPNYLLGTTFSNAITIVDESQTMSAGTIKLLTERCGEGSKYILLGDNRQTYSISKRDDGFKDLITRTTIEHRGQRISKFEPYVGYVKLNADDNQRSSGSKFINKLYEGLI